METISIIIPTYNETGNISRLIRYLYTLNSRYIQEIIVVDGGSTDDTANEAIAAGATVICSRQRGRAAQMNVGADSARGTILYFLHSDTFPPKGFDEMIVQSVGNGRLWGSFKVRFDYQHWFLNCITSLISLDFTFFRFGDQSLFVKKELFRDVGGYDSSHIVFEDTEIAKRLRALAKGEILKKPVVTSARKFRENGVYKMTLIFLYIWVLYMMGMSHDYLLTTYKRMIIQNKI